MSAFGGQQGTFRGRSSSIHVYVTVALHLKADLSLERAYVLDVDNRIPT